MWGYSGTTLKEAKAGGGTVAFMAACKSAPPPSSSALCDRTSVLSPSTRLAREKETTDWSPLTDPLCNSDADE